MDQKVNVQIIRKTITNFVLRNNPQMGAIQINVETNGAFGKPLDETKKSGAIIVRIEAKAENIEDFHILLVENFEYSFEETPEDYDMILQSIFNGMALPEAAEDLDKALIALGKTPIKIKDIL